MVVLHRLLCIEQHDESGEIMLSGSGTMTTHFFASGSMYGTDKSIPVEPPSFCLTGGAVTDVHRWMTNRATPLAPWLPCIIKKCQPPPALNVCIGKPGDMLSTGTRHALTEAHDGISSGSNRISSESCCRSAVLKVSYWSTPPSKLLEGSWEAHSSVSVELWAS